MTETRHPPTIAELHQHLALLDTFESVLERAPPKMVGLTNDYGRGIVQGQIKRLRALLRWLEAKMIEKAKADEYAKETLR